MSAIIKTLKTTTNDVEQSVYPKTVLEAVVDADTNQTLDVILDNIKSDTPNGSAYVDFNEQSGEVTGEVEAVTSAKLVSYSNTESGIEATNVQDAIDVVNDSVDEVNKYLQRNGSRNLLKITTYDHTIGGFTVKVNEDKSISISGQSSVSVRIDILIGTVVGGYKADTEYILTGGVSGLPSGEEFYTAYHSDETVVTMAYDVGNGVKFINKKDRPGDVYFTPKRGETYDVTLYPMVREASVEDDIYEPYYEDVRSVVNKALTFGDVVDNYLSNDPSRPLSANAGYSLYKKVDNRLLYNVSINIKEACTVWVRDISGGNVAFEGLVYGGMVPNLFSAALVGSVPSGNYFTPSYLVNLVTGGPVFGLSGKKIKVTFSGSGVLNLMLNRGFQYCIGDSPSGNSSDWTTVN